MKYSVLYRISKLNQLLGLSIALYEQVYEQDQKDVHGEFTDELRALLKDSEVLQDRVMLEIEKFRKTIKP